MTRSVDNGFAIFVLDVFGVGGRGAYFNLLPNQEIKESYSLIVNALSIWWILLVTDLLLSDCVTVG